MPKFVAVDVSRKQFTQLLVQVPDDYDEAALLQGNNIVAIKHALKQERFPIWDTDEDDLEVEGCEVQTAEQAKGYSSVDIADQLAEVSAHWAKLRKLTQQYKEDRS